MRFVTTSREARLAPLLGLPMSSLSQVEEVESEVLGGYGEDELVAPEVGCGEAGSSNGTEQTLKDYVDLVCHKEMVEDVTEQMAKVGSARAWEAM
eukprot:762624-Hanusia_phi.AAC.1